MAEIRISWQVYFIVFLVGCVCFLNYSVCIVSKLLLNLNCKPYIMKTKMLHSSCLVDEFQ